jgi:hypothetical protein
MSVLEIRPAQREGARLVIGLAGWTGCGKTNTAILLAYGLAGYDASKVGFIDTENKRGSLLADVLQTADPPTNVPFLIGDLVAPFSPQRYIEAINDFEKSGVEVCIVDSISHEHEGPGGLIDIAGEDNKYWNRAKREHKKFVNALLQSSMHIIVCVRAREKVGLGKNANGKTEYQDEGLQPVTEKNLMFDMTASLMMYDQGTRQERLKVPGALEAILGRGKGYITPADGKMIRDWVDGAKQLDPTVEKFRMRLLSNCEQGLAHIKTCWDKTPPDVQTALGPKFHETLEASAKAYDDGKAAAAADHPHDPATAPGTPAATVAANAIAKAAADGRAAKVESQQQPAAAPAATPPAQPQAKTPEPTPKPEPKPEPAKPEPAKPEPAKPAPATEAKAPVNKVTAIRPAAAAAAAPLPLATPPAAKKAALQEPMF